jgi:drug/metabolite transporter (DMT)-like permease
MDGYLLGQFAALLTSCFWTFNSILFAQAGKRIGSLSVNAIRIVFAVVFLTITHLIFFGQILPLLESEQFLWIGLSGVIGLGIGDFALFAAFVIIGPRLSVLIMATSPIYAAILGYFILGETLSFFSILGIAITIFGVCSVILVTREHQQWPTTSIKESIYGSILGFIGAAGQGTGVVLAKKGILFQADLTVNPISAALIRMITAAIFICICVIIAGKLPKIRNAIKNATAIKFTLGGAFLGPFLGVTLSMVAVTYADVGVAQTLMSLMPIIIIPVMWIVYKEKTSIRGILGAIIAIVGVAILFLT